jgi:NDP-sugar pyrophosphorylase family protein
LTAGLATRLRPLSDFRAKAALPVAGDALIARILRWLRASGVQHVVLNLHHRPETVTSVVGDGADWDLDVRYSWEMPVLGSAGGPKRAIPLLDADRFLIVNGDTLTDCDLHAIATQHVETGALVTMAVVRKDVDRVVVTNSDGIVTRFGTRSSEPTGAWHFIGVQAVDAAAFAGVSDDLPCETVKELYPDLIKKHPGSVRAYCSAAEFLDVGTARDYLATVDAIARREGRRLDCGVGTRVDPTARVEHSILWDRVQVHEYAELTDCIVGDDVVIPPGSTFDRSVVVNGKSGLQVSSL